MSKRLRGPGDLSGQCDVILAACVAFCLALALDAAGEGSGRLDSGEDRLDGSQRGVGGAEGLSKLREWTAEDAGALLAKRDVRQSFARDARGMAPRWTDDNNALILATGIPILARRTDEGYDTAVREVTDSYAALGIFLGFEPALGSADQLWLEAGISEPGAQVLERFRENLSLKELLKGLRQAGLLREEADAVADRALQILIDTRGFADAWDSVKGLTLRDRSMMAQSLLKAIEEHGGDKPFDLVSDIPYWALSVD